jgi:hypothetical protein
MASSFAPATESRGQRKTKPAVAGFQPPQEASFWVARNFQLLGRYIFKHSLTAILNAIISIQNGIGNRYGTIMIGGECNVDNPRHL